MRKLLGLSLFLLFATMLVAQTAIPGTVPTCNTFDANGKPAYQDASTPLTTMCTDTMGVANYANSPLPVGGVSATFNIQDGGEQYLNGGSGIIPSGPTGVVIEDFYGNPGANGARATATVTNGVVTKITLLSAGSGYIAPVVTINDPINPNNPDLVVAIVLAKLDKLTVVSGTGMRKFQDQLTDLKSLIATPDTTTYPGSDYYEIFLVDYVQQMHADLPPTHLRGYCQHKADGSCDASYLGPVILATKNRPVRVLFKNLLNPDASGDLFIPSDSTYMGAGAAPTGGIYTENRATLHLHGGNTPWISDGTPHQWTAPWGETRGPGRGVSTAFVPDMWFDVDGNLLVDQVTGAPLCQGQLTCNVAGATTDPGPGNMTFYWTNQQGGRLMFYHDHAYGITRLNVYAGEVAGYLLVDPSGEEDRLAAATAPGTVGTSAATTDLGHLIPLVIQDKSYVPPMNQLVAEDPTWLGVKGGGSVPGTAVVGDLWYPHVYTVNQNPADLGGANAFGRWDYGAWFWPPLTSLTAAGPRGDGLPNGGVTIPCTSASFPGQLLQPLPTNNYLEGCPIVPNPSGTPEAFMDTPVVNGKAYPVLHVAPEAYRFRLLMGGNDRAMNLSWFQACGSGVFSTLATNCKLSGAAGTEVPMVPAAPGMGLPSRWPTDGRDGGVPDPAAMGPSWYEIGTEGGLLPGVAVIPPTPVGFEYGRRSITVLNVDKKGLFLGPAERADAIVDFSKYAGKTLILYNDGPAPVPAFDARIDYYTDDPDQVTSGGAPTTLPGYGPNTRTIMQVIVDQPKTATTVFNPAALQTALPQIFAATQPAPIVPEPTYPPTSGGYSSAANYGRISDDTITYVPIGATAAITGTYEHKAIQELFTLDYGRMNATLGVELPLTNFMTQTTIPYGYVDWPTEIMQDGTTQYWKLTHNGVDTHFIHFHLFNVQVINRIGWDGAIKPPDANELGWKDTVRMNPLEDIVFAIQPLKQNLPFQLPDSVRANDVTMPVGQPDPGISGLNPTSGNADQTNINAVVNFGWEYVWHCHILGHEENDMMRPIIFQVAPVVPTNVAAGNQPLLGGTAVTWTDASIAETEWVVERADDAAFTVNKIDVPVPSTTGPAVGSTVTYMDNSGGNAQHFYRVAAVDGLYAQYPVPTPAPFQTQPVQSAFSAGASMPVPPNVTISITPPPTNGWNRSGVTVVINATATSGIKAIGYKIDNAATFTIVNASSATLPTFNSGIHTIYYFAQDNNNVYSSLLTQPIQIDAIAPVITATAPSATPWYRAAVNIPWTAADTGGSGLVPPSNGTLVIPGDGTAQRGSLTVSDFAGNTVTYNSPTYKIDTVAPAITFGTPSPAPNANGWNNTTPVTVAYSATDATSGLASLTPASPASFTAAGANQTRNVTATDVAGNARTLATPAVSIDLTRPTVASNTTVPASGWFNIAAHTWNWRCTDALSGPVNATVSYVIPEGAANAFNSGMALPAPGCIDRAGNVPATQNSQTAIKVDLTAPTVTALATPPTATVLNGANQTVTVTGTVADALSGVNRTSGSYTAVGSVTGNSTGTFTIATDGTYTFTVSLTRRRAQVFTITVTARDVAGNPTSATTTFTVQ